MTWMIKVGDVHCTTARRVECVTFWHHLNNDDGHQDSDENKLVEIVQERELYCGHHQDHLNFAQHSQLAVLLKGSKCFAFYEEDNDANRKPTRKVDQVEVESHLEGKAWYHLVDCDQSEEIYDTWKYMTPKTTENHLTCKSESCPCLRLRRDQVGLHLDAA